MRGLALIVQFLAQAGGDFGVDIGGRDGAVVALVDSHREAQLAEIGLHRRSHLGVLQFAGERGAVERRGAMHLAQGGGAGGGMLEALEAALPVGPELALHAAAHEGPAHRGRVGLQLDQLADIFLRECLGDRGEELRHLHQWALDAAERRLQIGGMALAVDREAEIALAGEPRRQAAHRAPDPRVAAYPTGEAVVVGHLAGAASVRPSRRPLRGLLRMRSFRDTIKNLSHPEERPRARLEGTPNRTALVRQRETLTWLALWPRHPLPRCGRGIRVRR